MMNSSVNGLDSLKGTLDWSTFFNVLCYRRHECQRHFVIVDTLLNCVIICYVLYFNVSYCKSISLCTVIENRLKSIYNIYK